MQYTDRKKNLRLKEGKVGICSHHRVNMAVTGNLWHLQVTQWMEKTEN